MPCSDYSEADVIHDLSGQVKALTQIACELAAKLPAYTRAYLSKETLDWLAKHAKEDAARKARERSEASDERKRQAALSKLTAEERRLLGVRRSR